MNIVILGAPGVGKGTYAEVLSSKYNIPKISVGDLFRRAIKDETELGKRIKGYVSSGDLVPDEIVIELVKNRLEANDCKVSPPCITTSPLNLSSASTTVRSVIGLVTTASTTSSPEPGASPRRFFASPSQCAAKILFLECRISPAR